MRHHLIVAGVALAIGSIVGVISHLVARVIYLDLVAPIVIGMAVGAGLSAVIQRICYPRPRAAIAFAALAVFVVLITHVLADYAHERVREADKRDAYEEEYPWVRLRTNDLTLGYFLAERYGFLDIGPDHRLGSGLGPPGIIGVTVLELFIGVLIAALWVRAQAREPACPACQTWRLRYPLGRAAIGVTSEFLARLATRNGAGAADLISPPDTPEFMQIALMACRSGHDDGGGLLRVIERRRDRRQRWRRRHIADVPITRRLLEPVLGALVRAGTSSDNVVASSEPALRDHRSNEDIA